MKTAVIFGASGLVGRHLMDVLISGNVYSKVKLFLRKPHETPLNDKIEEVLFDTENIDNVAELISGDDLFICIGTTIKKAGSKENMESIDRYFVTKIAKIALNNGLKNISVVSSIGANKNSGNSYLRIKGLMEDDLQNLEYNKLIILRPSFILGNREEFRFGEKIGKILILFFGIFLFGRFKKYKAIRARTIARAMIYLLNSDEQEIIYESNQVQEFGSK